MAETQRHVISMTQHTSRHHTGLRSTSQGTATKQFPRVLRDLRGAKEHGETAAQHAGFRHGRQAHAASKARSWRQYSGDQPSGILHSQMNGGEGMCGSALPRSPCPVHGRHALSSEAAQPGNDRRPMIGYRAWRRIGGLIERQASASSDSSLEL